ncbi:ASCH domain-containing protein [Estrella lausannensis]|uniref:ASCH domain-containing protein n=1 Tax=Estrella lausannensis TaxID=483423 RepID=A0A0H5DS65_9BACT|nr:ASCH domain-containing protein [Estrella lausannensis]CRX39527.1 conserved hypothetical protein [Estrella lausannensis]
MKQHRIHCEEPYFSLIREGLKRVEGRKNSPKYQLISPGDTIEFYCGDNSFLTTVTEIRRYDTLTAYLEDVTPEKALPGIQTMEEATAVYLQWSTEEEIARSGFLGIFVKTI